MMVFSACLWLVYSSMVVYINCTKPKMPIRPITIQKVTKIEIASKSVVTLLGKPASVNLGKPIEMGNLKPSGRSGIVRNVLEAKPRKPTLPSKIFIPVGEKKEISCTVASYPPAKVTWYKIQKEYQVSDFLGLNQRHENSLPPALTTSTISLNWSPHIRGRYMCEAANRLGTNKAYTDVMVGIKNITFPHENKGIEAYRNVTVVLEENTHDNKTVIGLSCGLGILFFLLCMIVIGYQVRSLKYRFAPQLAPNEQFELDPSRTVQEQASELPYNMMWEFPRINLSLQHVIGTGNFGEVWEALAEGIRTYQFVPGDDNSPAIATPAISLIEKESDAHSSPSDNGNGNDNIAGNAVAQSADSVKDTDHTEDGTPVKQSSKLKRSFRKFFSKYFCKEQRRISFTYASRVAVKCLKEDATEEDYTNFAGELKIMIRIGQHKNIVNILGACTLRGPLWVILEFCPHGDLLQFLRKRREVLPQWKRDPECADMLCLMDLLRMAIEITEGMRFLSDQGIVHRDLAARNILVGEELEMKVADFGMARDVGGTVNSEYQKQTVGLLPVRWMAPESLHVGKYTSASDMWSQGVVLWELFSMGFRPYPGITIYDLAKYLDRGHRMESPNHCPEEIYKVMLRCWSAEAKDRPTFSELHVILSEISIKMELVAEDEYYTIAPGSHQVPTHLDVQEDETGMMKYSSSETVSESCASASSVGVIMVRNEESDANYSNIGLDVDE